MKKIIMNSFLLILSMGLFFCNSSKRIKVSQDFIGIGEWLQVKTVVRNEKSHMAAYNLWTYDKDTCRMMKMQEYGYKVSNNFLEFYPLKGYEYVEWEKFLMFNKFKLDISDSTMVLTCKDTLQLFFERPRWGPDHTK